MRVLVPALIHTQNWLSLESEKSYPMTGDKVIQFLRSQKLEVHSNKDDFYVELNSTQFEELNRVVDEMNNYDLVLSEVGFALNNDFTLKCF
ncbi:hypothetical protein OAE48_02190 [Flavobacteriales bacterium]|nr:hypothetical protein [Flavobacteriales bacterium]